MKNVLPFVQMLDEHRDPAVVSEDLLSFVGLVVLGLFGDRDLHALVEERQLPQAVGQGVVREVENAEDLGIRLEGDPRARARGLAARGKLGGRLAPTVLLDVGVPVAADLHLEPFREPVDARDAHPVETARHLVRRMVELSARVERGQDDLDGGLVEFLVHVHGDAPAVVRHAHGAVTVDDNVDVLAEPGHGLVHGVIHGLVHEVVQAANTRIADVHRRTLANRLDPAEHLDGSGVVFLL